MWFKEIGNLIDVSGGNGEVYISATGLAQECSSSEYRTQSPSKNTAVV